MNAIIPLQYYSNTTPIPLQYYSNTTPLPLQYHSNTTPILLHYYSNTTPIPLHCYSTVILPSVPLSEVQKKRVIFDCLCLLLFPIF